MMDKQVFFIVGTAKAGTSSLYEYLNIHPEVHMCRHKDVTCYFCREWGLAITKQTYLEWLLPPGNYRAAGDVCHGYMTDEDAARKIYNMFPDARIIMILRNPADRAFSMYNWLVANGFEYIPSFEAAVAEEKNRIARNIHKDRRLLQTGGTDDYLYVQSGMYSEQIARYQRVYPAEQILFLKFEDLCADTNAVLRRIYEFIGVDASFNQRIVVYNEKRAVRSVRLQYFIRKAVFPFFGNRIGSLLLRLNSKDGKKLKMKPETRAGLLNCFRDDIKKTEEITGLDLSNWMN